MIPALGFQPDIPATTPGVFTDCTNIVPTLTGFKAAPSMTSAGYSALADTCRGTALITRLDNTRRFFAATPAAIYEDLGGTWTDRSRAGGYTAGGENRYRFAQFGNATLIANQVDVLQVSTDGAFADIADAPQARIIETVAGFVMALATVDADNGDQSDRWWCSGLYDHLAWTPSAATQCANGRLIDSPGEIRAGRKLGNDMVVYKEKSMYLGQYVGPPVIWQWQQVPGDVGALSQECVVNIGTAHVFIGNDDFWMFDGTRPVSIGAPVRYWFFKNASRQYLYRTQGYYDRFNALVYWYFVSNKSAGVLDECLIYNVKTGKWGRTTRSIAAPVEYVSPGITFDDMGDVYETYDDIAGATYDSPQWFAQGQESAVFDTAGLLQLLNGPALPSSITVHDAGDDSRYSTLSRVRPRFTLSPISGSLQAYFKEVEGDALQVGETATLEDGKFDLMWSARWHRVQMNFTGEMEMNAYNLELTPDGTQ